MKFAGMFQLQKHSKTRSYLDPSYLGFSLGLLAQQDKAAALSEGTQVVNRSLRTGILQQCNFPDTVRGVWGRNTSEKTGKTLGM